MVILKTSELKDLGFTCHDTLHEDGESSSVRRFHSEKLTISILVGMGNTYITIYGENHNMLYSAIYEGMERVIEKLAEYHYKPAIALLRDSKIEKLFE